MSKYDIYRRNLIKAQTFPSWESRKDEHDNSLLKEYDRQRKIRESRDDELLNFGIELYENGYELSAFREDLRLCFENDIANPDDNRTKSFIEYSGITKVPSYKKLLSVAYNPELFRNIENGYNIGRRRELAKACEEKNKSHRSR